MTKELLQQALDARTAVHKHYLGQAMPDAVYQLFALVRDDVIPALAQQEPRCQYCDGTGDVHSPDGQWRGKCHCKAQQEQPAQEPVETVTLVGIKDGVETVLGTVSTPPEMKAREIIRNYGWNPDDQGDLGEGETAMCIVNDLLAWMKRQGSPKIELATPPTQPVHHIGPLSEEHLRDVVERTKAMQVALDAWVAQAQSGQTEVPCPLAFVEQTAQEPIPGMAVTALAGEIIEALLADEKDGGYDLTAGLFGANFSTLVRRFAKAEWWCEPPTQPAQKPDLWKTQFLTDVMTSAGLLMHGRTDKKLAQRIADGSARWRTELYASAPTQPSLSDDEILNCFYASKSEGMVSYMLAVGRAIEAHCRGGAGK